MNKLLEKLRNDFQGGAEALIEKAQEIARALSLDQEATEGNERLLRHYVSMGVVDKPSREGRDALYGFRHLMQFVAARRLLADGFPLAKIAGYTGAVTTDMLVSYLEKPGKASEAELLVAAFRSTTPERKATGLASRQAPPRKTLPSMATGMGMVDVMHEMRDMEHRVRMQIDSLQQKVHAMVEDAVNNLGVQRGGDASGSEALKQAMSQMAVMMDEAAHRFDALLQKPMAMIEKQMEQQRFMFDEAHRQKDFLDRMFGNLLKDQRYALENLADMQMRRLEHLIKEQTESNLMQQERMRMMEHEMSKQLEELTYRLKELAALPVMMKDKKEGAA